MSKTGVEIIAEERKRQIEEKGFTPQHDLIYDDAELADSAALYAMSDGMLSFIDDDWGNDKYLSLWGFDLEWYKPTPDDRIKQLAKAGAMIAAEIDRLNELKK